MKRRVKAPVRNAQSRRTRQMYPVVVQEEVAGGYWVACPALEGCYSQGKTVDEALQNIQEAIALCEEELPTHGEGARNISLHFVRV